MSASNFPIFSIETKLSCYFVYYSYIIEETLYNHPLLISSTAFPISNNFGGPEVGP